MDSVFDIKEDEGAKLSAELNDYVIRMRRDSAMRRTYMAAVHKILSEPRELDDEDLCVRDGYRDIVSMMREMQMAGRTLSAARVTQYDPQGVDDVDPTTRPDYSYMDAVDDVKRVSERLKAQTDNSPAPETPAQAPETPAQAPEMPSSQSAQ